MLPIIKQIPQTNQLNAELETLILQERERFPGCKLGVGTGWSGLKSFLEIDNPATHVLGFFIHQAIPSPPPWNVCGWPNIMDPGDTISPHDHEHSHLGGKNLFGGVYYVSCPGEGGRLILHDGDAVEVINPVPGLLVVFDAMQVHSVEEYRGPGRRVSVGFNCAE